MKKRDEEVQEELVRLNKFLSHNSNYSRREADKLIEEGKVKVNGKVVTNLATKVSNNDEVEIGRKKIKEDKNKKLNTLSLGKQRLALLARTIVKNPELLILDEPCQGLDVQQTKYFNRVVDDLCNSGHTLIYVGHFESQLPESLSHKLILEKGEIKNEKFQ